MPARLAALDLLHLNASRKPSFVPAVLFCTKVPGERKADRHAFHACPLVRGSRTRYKSSCSMAAQTTYPTCATTAAAERAPTGGAK